MSRIVPFEKCIARPESSLVEHLLSVKQSMEYFLQDFDNVTVRLSGLAGVCHDLAKAHVEWQAYIQSPTIKKVPIILPAGPFCFPIWVSIYWNQMVYGMNIKYYGCGSYKISAATMEI